jgi:hypothetical protein
LRPEHESLACSKTRWEARARAVLVAGSTTGREQYLRPDEALLLMGGCDVVRAGSAPFDTAVDCACSCRRERLVRQALESSAIGIRKATEIGGSNKDGKEPGGGEHDEQQV